MFWYIFICVVIPIIIIAIIICAVVECFSFFGRRPYRCLCGFEAYSKEEITIHIEIVKQGHKLLE